MFDPTKIVVREATVADQLNFALADITSHKVRKPTSSRWRQFGQVALLKVRETTPEPIGFSVMHYAYHYDLAIYDGYTCGELHDMLVKTHRLGADAYYKQFKDPYSLMLYVLDKLGVGRPQHDDEDDTDSYL